MILVNYFFMSLSYLNFILVNIIINMYYLEDSLRWILAIILELCYHYLRIYVRKFRLLLVFIRDLSLKFL